MVLAHKATQEADGSFRTGFGADKSAGGNERECIASGLGKGGGEWVEVAYEQWRGRTWAGALERVGLAYQRPNEPAALVRIVSTSPANSGTAPN